jgi:hypothetical protein
MDIEGQACIRQPCSMVPGNPVAEKIAFSFIGAPPAKGFYLWGEQFGGG